MERNVTDDLQLRLRAARPRNASADENAFDAELLARVRTQPIAARRSVPRAVALPVAAGVTLTATAVVMLAGGPGDVAGPSSASAITQALRWLNPPAGTILHSRSVEVTGSRTTTHESWQSADDASKQRERETTPGAPVFERSGSAFYDGATDTIYDGPADKVPPGEDVRKPGPGRVAAPGAPETTKPAPGKVAAPGAPGTGKPGDETLPSGDPIVGKVRTLMQDGEMVVGAREFHNGVDAWPISLKPDAARPVWTLWVSAADGKPLELRDPGRDANEQPQVIRWPTYEVLPGAGADQLLTLTGAHPSARVVHDPAEVAAAEQRLMPAKG
jgi:hypothetical protein